jgi:hypothetical protein
MEDSSDEARSKKRKAGEAAPPPAKRAPAAEPPTCPICVEPFTKQQRAPAACPYCAAACCRACLATYLLGAGAEPACMQPGCKRPWTREFVDSATTAAFRAGPLKAYREQLCFDRERARLPATQADAERYVAGKRASAAANAALSAAAALVAAHPLSVALAAARAAQKQTAAEFRAAKWAYNAASKAHDPSAAAKWAAYHAAYRADGAAIAACAAAEDTAANDADMCVLRAHERNCRRAAAAARRPVTTLGADAAAANGPAASKRTFVRACPSEGCRGFLDTNWVCGLCRASVCRSCHEVLATAAKGHECEPDRVATAALIVQSTRPCPGCGALVSKVSGCDQIWCTQCHTAFSWATGQRETGVVHNPHYYEWLRREAGPGNAIPRAAGDDGGGGCGAERRLPDWLDLWARAPADLLQRRTAPAAAPAAWLVLQRAHAAIGHVGFQLQLGNRYGAVGAADNRDLRVRYLAAELDEAGLRAALQRREKARYRATALRHVAETFVAAGRDVVLALAASAPGGEPLRTPDVVAAVRQLEALRAYTNDCFADVAARFGCELRGVDWWRPDPGGTVASGEALQKREGERRGEDAAARAAARTWMAAGAKTDPPPCAT